MGGWLREGLAVCNANARCIASPASPNVPVVDKYKVSLVLAGTSTKYTVETSVSVRGRGGAVTGC